MGLIRRQRKKQSLLGHRYSWLSKGRNVLSVTGKTKLLFLKPTHNETTFYSSIVIQFKAGPEIKDYSLNKVSKVHQNTGRVFWLTDIRSHYWFQPIQAPYCKIRSS